MSDALNSIMDMLKAKSKYEVAPDGLCRVVMNGTTNVLYNDNTSRTLEQGTVHDLSDNSASILIDTGRARKKLKGETL